MGMVARVAQGDPNNPEGKAAHHVISICHETPIISLVVPDNQQAHINLQKGYAMHLLSTVCHKICKKKWQMMQGKCQDTFRDPSQILLQPLCEVHCRALSLLHLHQVSGAV